MSLVLWCGTEVVSHTVWAGVISAGLLGFACWAVWDDRRNEKPTPGR